MASGTIRKLPGGNFQVDFQSGRIGQKRTRRNFASEKAALIFLEKTREEEALKSILPDSAWQVVAQIRVAAEEMRLLKEQYRDWYIADWQKIDRRGRLAVMYTLNGGRCTYCKRMTEIGVRESHGATLDHVVPVIAGGSDDFPNMALACRRCNTKKGTKERWQSF
jgi:hypothetical protein